MSGKTATTTPKETDRLISPNKDDKARCKALRRHLVRGWRAVSTSSGTARLAACIALGTAAIGATSWMRGISRGDALGALVSRDEAVVLEAFGKPANTGVADPTSGTAAEQDAPPNVILVLLDDVGMNDIGFHSTDLMKMTPFINTLAGGGVRLDNYYSNHICTPARASLMTGRDSFLTGMHFHELSSSEPWGLPLEEATLANRFQAASYATHIVGKWNLGMFSDDYYPFNRGFETFLGFLGARETYYKHSWGSYYDFGFGDAEGYINSTSNTTRWGPELKGSYSTIVTAKRAIQVAEEHVAGRDTGGTDAPLFLYLPFQAVHGPLDVPTDDMFTEEQLAVLGSIRSEDILRRKFAKIIYFLDKTLEGMFERFDQLGLLNNTLVVVASDNGGCWSAGGSNIPYRGFKWTLFEGGVRAPALVWSKSESIIPVEARGTIYTGMMHALDWTPTLANITGIQTEGMGKPLSGFDHWKAIIGQRPESDPPVRGDLVLGRSAYEYDSDSDSMVLLDHPRGAYIHNGWKIIHGERIVGWFSFNPEDDTPYCPDCVTTPCNYYPYLNNTLLFHLETDPFEMMDLSNAMPDKVTDMLERWNVACADEIVPKYRSEDKDAFEVWKNFNDWIVAWK